MHYEDYYNNDLKNLINNQFLSRLNKVPPGGGWYASMKTKSQSSEWSNNFE